MRPIEAVEQAGYGAEALPSGPGGAVGDDLARAAVGGPDAARVRYLKKRLIVALAFLVPLSGLSLFRRSGSAAGSGVAGGAGGEVGGLAIPPGGAAECAAWRGVGGRAGVAGHLPRRAGGWCL
jgi:hypothetical protein